jgi:hypothetical protein
LIQEYWGPKVTIPDIEHLSGHLRELLPGHGYRNAWNLMAPVEPMRSPTVVAPALETLAPKENYDWSRIAFAQTAGLETEGAHWWMPLMLMEGAEFAQQTEVRNEDQVVVFRAERVKADQADVIGARAISHTEIAPRGARMSGLINQQKVPVGTGSCYNRYKLSKYLNSACLIHMGRTFTRADLVRTYANKYGGVHIEWNDSDEKHRAMAEAGTGITISDRNPVLYELLSIGQTLANSADAFILRYAAEAARISKADSS